MLEPSGLSLDEVGHDMKGNKHFAEDTGLARLFSGRRWKTMCQDDYRRWEDVEIKVAGAGQSGGEVRREWEGESMGKSTLWYHGFGTRVPTLQP